MGRLSLSLSLLGLIIKDRCKMTFSKMSVWLACREKKRKLMDAKRKKSERNNKRMRMDDTSRNITKGNFSVKESFEDGETSTMTQPVQTSNESLILPDLPNDVLDLIICNLDFIDCFHLGLACKSLFALVRNATGISANRVPCLLVLAGDPKTCSLFNPVHKEKYTINIPPLPAKARMLRAKFGWLLMAVEDQKSVFFLNPLTKATIILPDLPYANYTCFSFSCPPTSPDCIVITTCCLGYWTRCYICRRGDEQWSGGSYRSAFPFNMFDPQVIFYRGSFYCLSHDGRLAIFDPVQLTWIVKKKPKPDTLNPSNLHYLIESEGQLLRVIWADSPKRKSVHVRKLDHRRKQWKKIASLGDRALYVSQFASLSSRTLSASNRGKIYFPMLEDEKAAASFSVKTGEIQNADTICYYEYGCWIEPDYSEASAEELQWSKR